MTKLTRPKVLLCILDGFGHGKDYRGNALTRAKTPFLSSLYKKYPWTLLKSHGVDVGVPKGTQGGSEVGHLTMGAGRIVPQTLLRIDEAIKDGSFFKNKELQKAMMLVKKNKSALHILGMISDQGVHADLHHAMALLDMAKRIGLKKVFVHGITDGRDVEPQSAARFIQAMSRHMKKVGLGEWGTLIGRYYAMDRDKNLKRTDTAYDLYTKGRGANFTDPKKAILAAYDDGLESDYYLKPVLLNKDSLVHKKDAVIFFNFRTDRAAQLTERFVMGLKPYFVAFGPYTKKSPVAFPEIKVINNLGSVLSKKKCKQLRIAETEKFAHVTFFFNSQARGPYPGEDRILLPSPKCPSYADKPEMSANGITKKLLKELPKNYDFIALNFANLDLVGHSGDFKATVKAAEIIDDCLSKIVPAALAQNFSILITGDHGNAEYMIYEDSGGPCPSHTRNPVPLIFIPARQGRTLKKSMLGKARPRRVTAGLRDIAPTILSLLGLSKPKEMTGESMLGYRKSRGRL